MSNIDSLSGGDVFNARDLTSPQVAERFVAPAVFERLLDTAHCILEGPRGSGKTTLLRMLTAEAFALWRNDQPGPDIDYLGIFVPADVRWAKQLVLRLDRISDEAARDAVQQAHFSVAVSAAMIESIELSSRLAFKFAKSHPALFFEVDRNMEVELIRNLADIWGLDVPVPSFSGIRLALRKRQQELNLIAVMLSGDMVWTEAASRFPYLTNGWLDNLVAAVETANEQLRRPDQLWALLLDELEIVPEVLLRTIVDALRSTSNKIRFKLALSPTGSDLLHVGELGASSSFEDYRPVKLWYERKGHARAFSDALFASALSRSLGRTITPAMLPTELGDSWPADSAKDDDDTNELLPAQASTTAQRIRNAAFSSLYQKDESFAKLLDDFKIDSKSPPTNDDAKYGPLVRKITQLVLHRSREVENFSLAKGVSTRKGGRKGLQGYFGFPNLVDLTEGNPRWILTLAETLTAEHAESKLSLKANTVQSKAIRTFVQQMVAKLTVFPTKAAAAGRRWTPFDFVSALGGSIESTLFDGPFMTDPQLSFTIDQPAITQYGDYVRTAIDLGALVIVRRGGPAPLAAGGDGQTLVGSRVRITYRLAPEFRLPLLFTKEQKMSVALRSGELLSTKESRARTKRMDDGPQVEGSVLDSLPVQGRLL
jgi:hypothetical protein